MGRELRRVAKDWHHPLYRLTYPPRFAGEYQHSEICFKPLHQAAPGMIATELAERNAEAIEDDEPPCYDAAGWMPDWPKEERTHWQIYETVSEGTPVSPVFATKDELLEWMVQPIDRTSIYNGGADWQCMQGRSRESAAQWLDLGWSPSGVMVNGVMMDGVEGMLKVANREKENQS